jgi:hypothetical protein
MAKKPYACYGILWFPNSVWEPEDAITGYFLIKSYLQQNLIIAEFKVLPSSKRKLGKGGPQRSWKSLRFLE